MEGAGAGAGAGASSRRRRFVPSSERRRAAPGRAAGPRGPGPARRRCAAPAGAPGPACPRGATGASAAAPFSARARARLAVAVVAAPPRAARLTVAAAPHRPSRRRAAGALASSCAAAANSCRPRGAASWSSLTSADTTRGVFGWGPRRLRAPGGVEVVRDVGREPRRVDARRGLVRERRVQRRRDVREGSSERVGLVYFIAVRGLELPLLVLAPRDLRVPRRDVRAETVVLSS